MPQPIAQVAVQPAPQPIAQVAVQPMPQPVAPTVQPSPSPTGTPARPADATGKNTTTIKAVLIVAAVVVGWLILNGIAAALGFG